MACQIDPRSLNLYFSQALQRAGLPTIRLHDARHTDATWMLKQSISPKVVQTMLGHSSLSVTLDIDGHVSLELETQTAASRLEGREMILGECTVSVQPLSWIVTRKPKNLIRY
jgi:integrase